MMVSQAPETVPQAETLQRLLNGREGDYAARLRDYFDGKVRASADVGRHALVHLLMKAALSPAAELAAVDYLADTEGGLALLEDRVLPAITRRTLDSTRHAVSDRTAAYAHLKRLLNGHGAYGCGQLIADEVTSRICAGRCIDFDLIRTFLWTGAFISAIEEWRKTARWVFVDPVRRAVIDRFAQRDPEVREAFLGHALMAAKKCEADGQFGIAAGIFASLGILYRQLVSSAASCGQHIRPDWLESTLAVVRRHDQANPADDFDASWKRLFGDESIDKIEPKRESRWDHPKLTVPDAYTLTPDGNIVIAHTPVVMVVASKMLARGNWGEATRFIEHRALYKRLVSTGVNLFLVPAMDVAFENGDMGVAAALGQVTLALGIIPTIAKESAELKFKDRENEVWRRLYDSQGPWSTSYPPELLGGSESVPSRSPDPVIQAEYDLVQAEKLVYMTALQEALVRKTKACLDEALKRGDAIALNLF